MGEKIKITLDTNVILSALLWKGVTRKIFELDNKKFSIITSIAILQELERVLDYPHIALQITDGLTKQGTIDRFLGSVDQVVIQEIPFQAIVEDPSDNIVLSCAVIGDADYIISGDKHILRLKQFLNIPIMKPREFLGIFEKTKTTRVR